MYVNISGIVFIKSVLNCDNVIKLMEFLLFVEVQWIYVEVNIEYLVNLDVQFFGMVVEWGEINLDDFLLQEIVDYWNVVVKLVDCVDYDGE